MFKKWNIFLLIPQNLIHKLYKFLIFSPADPNDLPEFLKQILIWQIMAVLKKNMLNITPLNYYNCINQFFKHVYSSELSSYYPEYAKSIEEISKAKNSLHNLKEIINAYVQLQKLKKYKDALILNLIYSLGVNPQIVLLHIIQWMLKGINILWYFTIYFCSN